MGSSNDALRPASQGIFRVEPEMLGTLFRKAWDNPERLYTAIFLALDCRIVNQEILAASQRLCAIDPEKDRSLGTLGAVHLRLGDCEAAQHVLEGFIRDHGETGDALTNLAKAYDGLGQHGLAVETLRRGLQLDPNKLAGLTWYAVICRDRDGPVGMLRAFEEIAAEPNSWRVLLFLARNHLDNGRPDEALRLYRRVLTMDFAVDALTMLTGDLAIHGYQRQAVELVAGRYVPQTHDVSTGMNLLQCFADLGEHDSGKALLAKMRALGYPQLEASLAAFGRRFSAGTQ
jgi:tetratricopeptide (TPR) repeat protein